MKTMTLPRSVTRVLALVCSFTIASSAFLLPVSSYAVVVTVPATTVDKGGTAVVSGGAGQTQQVSAGGVTTSLPVTTVNNNGNVIIDFSNLGSGGFKVDILNNHGTVYGIAHTGSGVTQGVINANTISNYGLITTILPQGGLPGYSLSNLIPNLSLVFNVTNNLTNSGVIASANNLVFNATSASTQIVNQANAVMAATQNITFNASQVTNLGAILAGVNSATQAALASATACTRLSSIQSSLGNLSNLTGTLTFNNSLSNTLNVLNTGGVLAASNINFNGLPSLAPSNEGFFGFFNSAANVNVTGGDLYAQSVNVNAGSDPTSAGSVNFQANSVTGDVNAYGSKATIGVNTGDLSIASLTIAAQQLVVFADPLIYDKKGSLLVDFGKLNSQFGPWTFLAGRNISATPSSVGQTFNSGIGSIDMYAGQRFCITDGGNGYNLNGASGTGGNINLAGVNLVTNGQNVGLYANSGCANTGSIAVGNVTTSFLNNSLLGSTPGLIPLFAPPTAGGNVTISGGQGGVSVGAITTNGANGDFIFSATDAGSINIKSKGDIVTGALTAIGGNGSNGFLGSPDGANGGNITVKSRDGSVTLLGDVLSKGGNGADGPPGFNNINTSPVFFTPCLNCFPSSTAGGNGGQGGNIKITANGDLTTQKVQSVGGNGGNGATGVGFFESQDGADGGNGGNSGTIKLTSKNGNVVLNGCVGTLGGNGGNGGDGSGGFFGAGQGGYGGFGGNARNITIKADDALIAQKIESFGGNAGNGGNGGDAGIGGGDGGSINSRCNGQSGGSSGTVAINAGSTNITDTVETLGGNGGNGGNGGGAELYGGRGGDGGRAGDAGDISINTEDTLTTNKVLSFGGTGGNGGTGGIGYIGTGDGGNAGGGEGRKGYNTSGGNSGYITLNSGGDINLLGAVQTAGGAGGAGGNGGPVSNSGNIYSWVASGGGNGGNGGSGGSANDISVNANNNVTATAVLSFGGNGGSGGNGTDASTGGNGGDGAGAGNSGSVFVSGGNSVTITGPVQTSGGNGGNGGRGGTGASTISQDDSPSSSGFAGSGGNGGRGGCARDIQLVASSNFGLFGLGSGFGGSLTTNSVSSFGGAGGAGGVGGNSDTYAGNGGDGASGGSSGGITLQTGIFGSINAKGDIQTAGGAGGNGGNPGVQDAFWNESSGGGQGGRGGRAGSITISTIPATSDQILSFVQALDNSESGVVNGIPTFAYILLPLIYIGSQGGQINGAGDFASAINTFLSTPTLSTQRVMSFGGAGGAGGGTESGGNGGSSGSITIANVFGGTYLNGTVQTSGGRGGDGGGVSSTANGNWGGDGGRGGRAGDIFIGSLFGNVNTNKLLSFGGDGGNGGAGASSFWDGAGEGGDGGKGGRSGNIRVQTLFGSANLNGAVQTKGGNGGNGGAGGVGLQSEGWSDGGDGGEAGNGGKAGNISIGAFIGDVNTQDVMSFGGNGGVGGSGGSSLYAGWGGSGGNGGKSGSISVGPGLFNNGQSLPVGENGNLFTDKNIFGDGLSFLHAIGIHLSVTTNGTLQTKGGDGGAGGAGGISLVDDGEGGRGGSGGLGGNARNITVRGFGDVSTSDVLSFGGNGGAGGAGGFGQQTGGDGGTGYSRWNEGRYSGGNSGSITIGSLFGSVNLNGTVQTAGGDGGAGGVGGSTAGVDEEAYAGSGGYGGRGGNGGSIYISSNVGVTTNAVMSFGGNGGAGGAGGNFYWPGDGGNGGHGGNAGHIKINAPTLTVNGPIFLAKGAGGQGGAGGQSGDPEESGDTGRDGCAGNVGCININTEITVNAELINYIPQTCCAGRVSAKSPVSAELPMLAVNPVPGETGFCCNPTTPVVILGGTPNPPGSTPSGPNPGTPGTTPPTFTAPFDALLGLLPNTDTTRNRAPSQPNIEGGADVDYLDEISDNNSPNWVVITNKGQPYALQGDDGTLIIGTPGTIFGQTGDHTITLKQGSILVVAGAGLDIQTPLGLISVKPGGAAGISEGRFGGLDIANLGSDKVVLSANYKGNTSQVTVGSNQQLDVSTSEIATAGASDFVPSADSMAAIVAGLTGSTSNVTDGKNFLAMLQAASTSNLSPGLRASLNGLLQSLMGIGNAQGNKSPLSYRPSEDGKYYVPVGFAVPTTSVLNMDEMSLVTLTGVQARCLVSTQMTTDQGGKVNLKDGDVLVDSNKATEVMAGNCRITVAKKTIALISRKGDLVKVRNIVENSADSVTVTVGSNRAIILHAGQEAVSAPTKEALNSALKADSVARRHIRAVDSDKEHLTVSEFSIISLCSNSKLMNRMIRSEQSDDKRVYEKMLKMAACLSQVTSSHGAYEQAK